jgi:hypothetical protein
LRRARVRIAADPRFADPHDWALLHVRGLPGFVAFPRGEVSPPARGEPALAGAPAKAPAALLLAAAGLGGIAVGWLLRRRGPARAR